MNNKLIDEITKILIISYYEVKNNGSRGTTAQEIINFEKRAIDEYFGKSNYSHVFYSRVERDVALILRAIDHNRMRADVIICPMSNMINNIRLRVEVKNDTHPKTCGNCEDQAICTVRSVFGDELCKLEKQ